MSRVTLANRSSRVDPGSGFQPRGRRDSRAFADHGSRRDLRARANLRSGADDRAGYLRAAADAASGEQDGARNRSLRGDDAFVPDHRAGADLCPGFDLGAWRDERWSAQHRFAVHPRAIADQWAAPIEARPEVGGDRSLEDVPARLEVPLRGPNVHPVTLEAESVEPIADQARED